MANIRPLNAELQKAAIEQLNEVPERIPADLEALRTWIAQQPHLKSRNDDQFLLAFLRGSKFSLEKAKGKIDKYYAMRTKYTDFLTSGNVDDVKFREILKLGVLVYLPTPLNDNGPRIGVMRMGLYPVEKYTIEEVCRVMQAMQEIIMLEDDYAIIHGFVGIMDLSTATAAHMMQMTPSLMKKMTTYTEEAVPLRQKAMHFVNTFTAFEPIFNMVKPMMSKKQQGRLFVHGSKMDLLHQQIPKKYLPKEYGGDNGSIDEIIAEWEQKVLQYREHFNENSNYGTDESLRPGKPLDFDSMFGTEGSFRKLNVD